MTSEPINHGLSEEVVKAFSSFLEQADLLPLARGFRQLLLYYLRHEKDREEWFETFVEQLAILFDFIDELENTHHA